MAKLHELLAAEKTPTGAWNMLYDETQKKLKAESHFFSGHSKSLRMIAEGAENAAIEAAAREEKPVTTTVYETLEYALDMFAKAEDLQYQKNATNRLASGTVMWRGKELLVSMPIDELLGLEARLVRLRLLFAEIPTLDATKHWVRDSQLGEYVWVTEFPEETTKTEKVMTPVVMHPPTDKHPAQVTAATKDVVVGKYTTVKRSGAATALQKANLLKTVDEFLVAVKQARMRANETEAIKDKIADTIVTVLLEPLRGKE